jgi:hypothetical protein
MPRRGRREWERRPAWEGEAGHRGSTPVSPCRRRRPRCDPALLLCLELEIRSGEEGRGSAAGGWTCQRCRRPEAALVLALCREDLPCSEVESEERGAGARRRRKGGAREEGAACRLAGWDFGREREKWGNGCGWRAGGQREEESMTSGSRVGVVLMKERNKG